MSIFGSIKDKVAQYIDVHVRLMKLNLMGSASKLMSYLMFAMICMFIAFAVILLLGFGIAESFVSMGLSRVAAYFSTFGFYVLLLFVVLALRKNITGFFAGTFLKVLTDDTDDEGDDKQKN